MDKQERDIPLWFMVSFLWKEEMWTTTMFAFQEWCLGVKGVPCPITQAYTPG
jgi:hypothetical protein